MKKLYYLLSSIIIFVSTSFPVSANVNLAPLLNKVTLQFQNEQWVTTQTALVNVVINATLNDQDIGSLQSSVLDKLKKLSNKNEWHILSLNRQLDQSGLEKVQIQAQARLQQSELSNLRNKAKELSKPGETFSVSDISFAPSDEEIQKANSELRMALYQKAKNEIDILNKVYPDQKYYLYSIDFMPLFPTPSPVGATLYGMGEVAAKSMMSRIPPSVNIGNKIQLQATVVIASMPTMLLQQLTSPTKP